MSNRYFYRDGQHHPTCQIESLVSRRPICRHLLPHVLCADTAGHDASAPFVSVPELMDAFLGNPYDLLQPALVTFIDLQLLIDSGLYLEHEWLFDYIRTTYNEMQRERTRNNQPTERFRGSDDFWRRYFDVSFTNIL